MSTDEEMYMTCADEGLHRLATSRRPSSPLAIEATILTSQRGNDAITAIIRSTDIGFPGR
jgi:hypothetical protein